MSEHEEDEYSSNEMDVDDANDCENIEEAVCSSSENESDEEIRYNGRKVPGQEAWGHEKKQFYVKRGAKDDFYFKYFDRDKAEQLLDAVKKYDARSFDYFTEEMFEPVVSSKKADKSIKKQTLVSVPNMKLTIEEKLKFKRAEFYVLFDNLKKYENIVLNLSKAQIKSERELEYEIIANLFLTTLCYYFYLVTCGENLKTHGIFNELNKFHKFLCYFEQKINTDYVSKSDAYPFPDHFKQINDTIKKNPACFLNETKNDEILNIVKICYDNAKVLDTDSEHCFDTTPELLIKKMHESAIYSQIEAFNKKMMIKVSESKRQRIAKQTKERGKLRKTSLNRKGIVAKTLTLQNNCSGSNNYGFC